MTVIVNFSGRKYTMLIRNYSSSILVLTERLLWYKMSAYRPNHGGGALKIAANKFLTMTTAKIQKPKIGGGVATQKIPKNPSQFWKML